MSFVRVIFLASLVSPFCSCIWMARASARAQTSTGQRPTAASGSGAAAQPFDVKAAVDAYLARVPADQRARSDAYFEGGYWLLLWDFLSTVLVMWILLRFRWSARMRDLAERLTRFKPLQTALYWVQFVVRGSGDHVSADDV